VRVRGCFFGCTLLPTLLACRDPVAIPPPPAVALHVAPNNFDGPFAVNVGTDIDLVAFPVSADSTKVEGPIAATWLSSDTSLATVNDLGQYPVYRDRNHFGDGNAWRCHAPR
jgi:hypothetical protein